MDSYITFSVMVNLKAGDDISFLIIALRSSIQQLFRLVLDGLAVFEHLSICRWNVRSYQYTVIIGLWTKMVLCRALLNGSPVPSRWERICLRTFLTSQEECELS